MTPEQANAINLENESNPITLRKLVRYWQDKAFNAEERISNLQTTINNQQIPEILDFEKIKRRMKTD